MYTEKFTVYNYQQHNLVENRQQQRRLQRQQQQQRNLDLWLKRDGRVNYEIHNKYFKLKIVATILFPAFNGA